MAWTASPTLMGAFGGPDERIENGDELEVVTDPSDEPKVIQAVRRKLSIHEVLGQQERDRPMSYKKRFDLPPSTPEDRYQGVYGTPPIAFLRGGTDLIVMVRST